MDQGAIKYVVTVDVDSDRKETHEYKKASRAEEVYVTAIGLYGLGSRKPDHRGTIRLTKIDGGLHEEIRSAAWKPGFGWY
jgi:hypothetical protein